MNQEFKVHRLNPVGIKKSEEIAETFDSALFRLDQICHPGRHMSIVRTKLEEACFFAKKSMAEEAINQLPSEQSGSSTMAHGATTKS